MSSLWRDVPSVSRWADQQSEPVHHKVLPGVNHMEILRGEAPAVMVATLIENINKGLYEDERFFDMDTDPRVEVV